MYWKINILV